MIKHLTLNDRITIEMLLKERRSFKKIAQYLEKDCTTIAKEIKKHIIEQKIGCFGQSFNSCVLRIDCDKKRLCKKPDCSFKKCRFCPLCNNYCKEFIEERCLKLNNPPYVCNGCNQKSKCTLKKNFYKATVSQAQYKLTLSESRNGVAIDEAELQQLDKIISPLTKQGQSIHHICTNNADKIMYSEKTIYNYVDLHCLTVKNIDLPRKVKFRPRKKKGLVHKVDKKCRIGRTYQDFLMFIKENGELPVVQMDSVEGKKGGKVLLTIHFTETHFMLAFLRDSNTSQSVIDTFNIINEFLGDENFKKLFSVVLTDNGSEFSNPSAIEFNGNGERRTRIFYCDPSAPFQKPAVENNHEFIRKVLPKGKSFNELEQKQINLMMNHINSYSRKKLNDKSPYDMFSFLYGNEILEILGAKLIQPNGIFLTPSLIK